MKRIPNFFVVAIGTFLVTFSVHASWPQWRGPRGDSTSDEKNLPTKWSETESILWKSPIPEWGTSTPAIWNDAIFLTTQAEEKLLAMRLDAKTGKEVWTREIGKTETVREAAKRSVQKFHQLHNNASPSPVTDGELIVFHFGNGDMAVLDFDGRTLWKRNLQQEYGTYTIWWGHANSPVLVGDLIVSVCMQDSLSGVSEQLAPSYLVAHDKRTGREVWKSMRTTQAEAEQCDSYTTPLVRDTTDGLELIVMGGNQLDGYDVATGKQRWFLPGLVGGRTITGPTLHDNLVFCTPGQKKHLHAVRIGKSGQLGQSEILWTHPDTTPDSCCTVVANGLLFTMADNGVAMCFDTFTGKQHWKERIGGNFKASPVAADGKVYFLDQKGVCTVVAASDKFEVLATNTIEDETSASPAISDGRIYLRARKHLYCVGK